MKPNFFFLISFLLLPFLSLAQSQSCGTETTASDLKIVSELRKMIRSGELNSRDLGDGLIPVKYHIIAADDSTMGMDTAAMYAEMDIVQQRFAPAGMEFYQCGPINYIYDTDYVDFEKNVSEDICDAFDVPNVLNIWFADNVYKIDDGDVVSICGYAYLSGPNDRIIIDNDCGDNSSTLAHEIGHYFSLLHTHSTSGLGEELVDGSNCLLAGDLLCDTPADPKLSSSIVNSSCVYTGTETDSNSDLYEPDPENIMSYSRKHCRIEFTDDQLDQMANYVLVYRNYLSCSVVTDIAGTRATEEVHIYPNPFSSSLTMQYSVNEVGAEISIQIFNLLGVAVASKNWVEQTAGSVSNTVAGLEHLPSGIYQIRLVIGNKTIDRKLVRL